MSSEIKKFFFFQLAISLVIKVQIIHIISEMESWRVALFGRFSDLKNNKNSRSNGCSNKAKTVFSELLG